MITNKLPKGIKLPTGIEKADLVYPKAGEYMPYDPDACRELVFYYTEKAGWLVATLHISNPSRRLQDRRPDATARTYAIAVQTEKVWTVGIGQHVVAHFTAHVKKGNVKRLQRYIDLWAKGMADAGSIRDRISTRRAQGQLNRAAGMSSWYW